MTDQDGYALIVATRKTGNEPFHHTSKSTNLKLVDFWQWATSDLVSNTMRGILAEYIVASALGITDTIRVEWDSFDLTTAAGIKIEVKSSAYLQSWHHKKLSQIRFSIRPSYVWDANANMFEKEAKRSADIYVFCVLKHTVQSTLDPLDLDQWDFYIILASTLNEKFPAQKSISLGGLCRLEPKPLKASYHEIKARVAEASLSARKSTEG